MSIEVMVRERILVDVIVYVSSGGDKIGYSYAVVIIMKKKRQGEEAGLYSTFRLLPLGAGSIRGVW